MINSRMDDSSDEDVKDTFDRIRKSFVRNYANCDTETADKSLKSSSSSVLEEPDKENIGFSRKKGLNKRKFLLEDDDSEQDILIPVKKKMPLDDSSDEVDSDTEKIVSMKKKSLLNDSSDEEDSFIFMKENIVSMNKKKILLDDSDEENMPIDIQSELVSKNNSDERNIDMKKNNIVSSNKMKVLTEDIDEDHHVLTAVQKKLSLEDSDQIDSGNERSQMDTSGADKRDGGDKKNLPLLESSDSEEEIGMKKIKRFINNDSD